MIVTYQSSNYDPAKVTGKYVRCEGQKGAYRFKVFETATCFDKKSTFFGRPGYGHTLREYTTDGAELPEEIKNKAIATKTTVRWE